MDVIYGAAVFADGDALCLRRIASGLLGLDSGSRPPLLHTPLPQSADDVGDFIESLSGADPLK